MMELESFLRQCYQNKVLWKMEIDAYRTKKIEIGDKEWESVSV